MALTATKVPVASDGTHVEDSTITDDGAGLVTVASVLRVNHAVAVGSLPAVPTIGMFCSVNDALAPAPGVEVAAGGAATAVVCWGGTQWTVVSI